ncbi:MAG: CubicO group peptidase (beta-lactamase class C family) [Phenylobacterium sp.]|jgi:CubicO group peptidase (beta-lactamase class C family)
MKWKQTFAFLSLLLSAVVAGKSVAQQQNSVRYDSQQALLTALSDKLSEANVPGAGIVLVRGDQIEWAGGIGKADVFSNTYITADTQFRVGSVSKSFIALGILKLQQQGLLNINDPVSQWAADIDINNPWAVQAPLKIVHLLEHTSGFDDIRFNEIYTDSPYLPLVEVLAINPRSHKVRWQPGTSVSYSNHAYTLAAYIIEQASGMPFEDYITEQVLRPLNINTGGFRLTERIKDKLATGYTEIDTDTVKPSGYSNITLRPAGNLHLSMAELGNVVSMLIQQGNFAGKPLFVPEAISRMREVKTSAAAKHGLAAGFGLGSLASFEHGFRFYGHPGGISGFLSYYAYSPEQQVGFALVMNSDSADGLLRELTTLLAGYMVQDATAPPMAEPQAVTNDSSNDIHNYSGYYRSYHSSGELMSGLLYLSGIKHIYVEDGKFYQNNLFAAPQQVDVDGQGRFRRVFDSGAFMVSYQSGGETYLGTRTGSYIKTSMISAYLPLLLLMVALLLLISYLLFYGWLVFKLLWTKTITGHKTLLVNLLTVVIFFLATMLFLNIDEAIIGQMNVATISFFVLSCWFGLMSVISVVSSVIEQDMLSNRCIRYHGYLVSFACLGLTIFLWYWQVLGLQTWAW